MKINEPLTTATRKQEFQASLDSKIVTLKCSGKSR